jgi:hypothetical protein
VAKASITDFAVKFSQWQFKLWRHYRWILKTCAYIFQAPDDNVSYYLINGSATLTIGGLYKQTI